MKINNVFYIFTLCAFLMISQFALSQSGVSKPKASGEKPVKVERKVSTSKAPSTTSTETHVLRKSDKKVDNPLPKKSK